jgi:uncharacterized protein YeaO (DUF488 family)
MGSAGGGLVSMSTAKIRVRRIYEEPESDDGFRVLVDRLWPRGIRRDRVDAWLKDVAPSTELRRWFGHDPEKWTEFRERYLSELSGNPALAELVSLAKTHAARGKTGMTLLYGAKVTDQNHALVLREALQDSTLLTSPKARTTPVRSRGAHRPS